MSYAVTYVVCFNESVSLPAGVVYNETPRIIKTGNGYVCNTLLGIEFIVSKRAKAQLFFRVTKFDKFVVGENDVVRVHRSGIFWLLGVDDAMGMANQV